MIRRSIIVFCLIIKTIFCFSQDSVNISGYYILQYNKKILLSQIQEKERNPMSIITDYRVRELYFILTINKDTTTWIRLMEEDLIEKVVGANPNYKNIEYFMIPPFKKTNNLALRDLKINNHNTYIYAGFKNQFYICKDDSLNLYQIFYIKGDALRFKIENDYLNSMLRFSLYAKDILDEGLSRNIPSFYVYYFYNYTCDSLKHPKGFVKYPASPRVR